MRLLGVYFLFGLLAASSALVVPPALELNDIATHESAPQYRAKRQWGGGWGRPGWGGGWGRPGWGGGWGRPGWGGGWGRPGWGGGWGRPGYGGWGGGWG